MAASFTPMDPDAQLGYLLVVCAEQMSRAWHRALRQAGINPRQFSMLAVLAHEPGISQAELARRVLITPQSVSESLNRLIDIDLVTRGVAEPGKPAQLMLTHAGRAVLADAYPVVETFNRASFSALTGQERSVMARLLQKLIAP
ncbi:MarR family winged helix-turn-helix transcriptional regulator [Krasilnikovia sp. M28-CT-15]|uniref:MarR family winged helix-turn-helix transcriptional regulator n=1 Tax=Krasilnikovia sp. M28-CT-15 TaxID=3373540 RepID=UPI003876296C